MESSEITGPDKKRLARNAGLEASAKDQLSRIKNRIDINGVVTLSGVSETTTVVTKIIPQYAAINLWPVRSFFVLVTSIGRYSQLFATMEFAVSQEGYHVFGEAHQTHNSC